MTKDPHIILELSHAATPKTARAREMSTEELNEALGNWLGWKMTHGTGRTDQALAFKLKANTQLGRIRRELARRQREER